jgi:hypothetical protein
MVIVKNILFPFIFIAFAHFYSYAQPVPAADENIPYLMTFGPKALTSWGDDDFSQTFFFMIPESYKGPVYIRVYDPEIGGEVDELNGTWDTQMMYSVYGGKGAYSNPDARETDPKGNYKSGNLLASKIFGMNPKYEKNWYTFGPFNPTDGEYDKQFSSYIFKVICDGIAGDDGNMYRYYLSTSDKENKPIEGANAFAFEYSFRMWDNPKEVSHIYPYVDDKTISVKVSNFDWDNDGYIRVVSVARNGMLIKGSGDNNWVEDKFLIQPEEKNTSLDFQFIKNAKTPVKNNNVVINVRNQYNELLKFYTIPIGGVPKYKYKFSGEKDKD